MRSDRLPELAQPSKLRRLAEGVCPSHPAESLLPGEARCALCKEYSKKYEKQRALKRRAEAIAKYGGKCACCGETYLLFLTIDHVAPCGSSGRPKGNFYSWLKLNSWPTGFQVLCFNCNSAKRTSKSCPCPYRVQDA